MQSSINRQFSNDEFGANSSYSCTESYQEQIWDLHPTYLVTATRLFINH